MVLPRFKKIVRECQKRPFNAPSLASAIQLLQSDAADRIFQGASGILQEVEYSPNDNAALDKFCNCWIRLNNNESFIYVIQAAVNIGDEDLASFLIDEINKCIREIEGADNAADERDAQQMLSHLVTLNRNEAVRNRLGAKLLMKCGIPYYQIDKYYQRSEEDKLRVAIRDQCRANGPTGILVVYGMGGIGKSTMVQHLLRNEENDTFFCNECGIRYIVYLNAQSVSEEKPFKTASFFSLLCNSLLSVGLVENKYEATNLAENETNLRQRLQSRLDARCKMLLVLDDAGSDVVHTVSRMHSPYVRCIAVTRDYDKLNEFCQQTILLAELARDRVSELLQHVISDRLTGKVLDDLKKDIHDLAGLCFGLPIIASLVTSRLSKGRAPTDRHVKVVCKNLIKLLSQSDSGQLEVSKQEVDPATHLTNKINITIGALLQSSFREEGDVELLERYYGFLFFDKGQSLSISDMAVLWACDETEAEEICIRLADKSLARVDKQDWTNNYSYSVHDLMFDAAITNAKETEFGDSLGCIRSRIVNAQVLKAAVISKKLALLERIIKVTERTHLTSICSDQNAFIDRKTFFHFLYDTEWIFVQNRNVSADILCRLLVSLSNDQGSHGERLTKRRKLAETLHLPDDRGNRLLEKILKSSDKSVEHKLLSILTIQVFPGKELIDNEEEERYWREEAERFEDDKLYTAVIQGRDFEIHVQQIISASEETLTRQYGRGHTLIEVACRRNNLPFAKVLLQHGTPVDAKSGQNGETPLMAVARNGHVEIVQLLIDNQATINEKAENGSTALMFAAQNGNVDGIKLLINNQATINEKSQDGGTALMIAAEFGHVEVVQLLISNQAAVNQKDETGSTALMNAAHNGHVDVVQLLISKAATVNEKRVDGWTALMFAAQNGAVDVVQLLINSKAVVNEKTEDGWTPLMIAAQFGHAEVVQLLISSQAAVNDKNKNGSTSVMLAARNGYVDVVKLLISNQAIVNEKAEDGSTALMFAAQNGSVEVVQLLISKQAALNEKNEEGWTALMIAAQNHNVDVVQLLLTNQAGINEKNNDGSTALMSAAQNGNFEVAQLLISHQEAINWKNNNGRTALMHAAQNSHVKVAQLLISNHAAVNEKEEDGFTALMIAAQNGNVELIQLLIENQAAVNEKNKNSSTALMSAAQNGHYDVVKLLISKQAAVNEKAEDGSTALMFAAQNGHVKVVELLISNQAVLNEKNKKGSNALMMAAQIGHHDIVNLLISKQAAVNEKAEDGSTALLFAAQNGNVKVVELLANNQATVNEKTRNGLTPLMIAADNGHLEVVQLLISRRAAVNEKKEDGWTPLMFAAQNGHVAVAQLLINNQAAVNEKQNDGFTALMIAAQDGHVEVVQLLINNQAAINEINSYGFTALMIAVQNGLQEVVKLLLSAGAIVSKGSVEIALRNGHVQTASILQSLLSPSA